MPLRRLPSIIMSSSSLVSSPPCRGRRRATRAGRSGRRSRCRRYPARARRCARPLRLRTRLRASLRAFWARSLRRFHLHDTTACRIGVGLFPKTTEDRSVQLGRMPDIQISGAYGRRFGRFAPSRGEQRVLAPRNAAVDAARAAELRGPRTGSGCAPAAQERVGQRVGGVGVVAPHVLSGCHDLVDPVEHVGAQRHVDGPELGVELLHGAGADDRRGHPRVLHHERQREVHEGDPGVLGE